MPADEPELSAPFRNQTGVISVTMLCLGETANDGAFGNKEGPVCIGPSSRSDREAVVDQQVMVSGTQFEATPLPPPTSMRYSE